LFLALHQSPTVISTAAGARAFTPQPAEVAAVGEWAQSFVVTWLSTPAGAEESLRYYLPDVSALTLPTVAQVVSNPAVANLTPALAGGAVPTTAASTSSPATSEPTAASADPAEEAPARAGEVTPSATATSASSGTRVWQVTVGVDVQEPGPQGNVIVRRYFAVAVAYIPAGQTRPAALRSLGLPGPVSAPTAGQEPETGYREGLPVTGSVGSSVQAFLSAYLTDQGDVTRLLSPQAVGISAVRPVAYTQVQLRTLKADRRDVDNGDPSDGERVAVLATATVTGLDTQTRSAQFALTLTARDGRWEISQAQSTPPGSTSISDLGVAPRAGSQATDRPPGG